MSYHSTMYTHQNGRFGLLFFVAGILFILTTTVSAGDSDPDSIVLAVVGQDTIYSGDVDALLMDTHSSMGGESMRNFDVRKLLNKLVNDRLLIQEAQAMEIDRESWLAESVDQMRLERAAGLFARENYKPDLTVDSTEVDEYFQNYYSRMQIRTLAVQDQAEAEATAAAIRGGADMDSIAREKSLDSRRVNGGLRNFSYYGDIESAYRDRADLLAVGELSDPFPYRDVYSMVRLERRADADPNDLPGLIRKITSVLTQWKNEAARKSFLDSLMTVYPITVDTTIIMAIENDSSGLFTPEFMVGSERKVLVGQYDFFVTEDALRKKISHGAMTTATDPFDSIFTRGLETASIDLALRAGATKDGYMDRPEITAACDQFLDSSLIETYLQQNVVPQIVIEQSEIDSYYADHPDAFRNPSRYQFNRAFYASDTIANEALIRIRQGADFAYVVEQSGGKPGRPEENAEWLSLATFPSDMQKEIAALSVGDCTQPRQTESGWLLLQLRAVTEGDLRPLTEVSINIKSLIFADKFGAVMDDTIELLKQTYGVWLNDSAIEQYFGNE